MKFSKIQLHLNTLKYLKPTQIYYQLWYRLKRRIIKYKNPLNNRLCENESKIHSKQATVVVASNLKNDFQDTDALTSSRLPRYSVSRNDSLHKTIPLEYVIAKGGASKQSTVEVANNSSNDFWNYLGNGKLWCYNLNYFDFIHDMDVETAKETILDYIKKLDSKSIGIAPYCISLRGINWIKWLLWNDFQDTDALTSSSLPRLSVSRNESLHKTIPLEHVIAVQTGLAQAKPSVCSPSVSEAICRNKRTATQIINSSLYSQYQHLTHFLEYHLMGNHLLENAISLLWAGVYFQNDSWIKKSCKLLTRELQEQILPDGSHFELSPMYHQILLDRLLDTYSFLGAVFTTKMHARVADCHDTMCLAMTSSQDTDFGNTSLREVQPRSNLLLTNIQKLLKTIIPNMLSYLNSITFSNGDIPLVNDSTNNVAPTTKELIEKAKIINIPIAFPLHKGGKSQSDWGDYSSGIIRTSTYELFVDVAKIGPSYIPGHAHADTFNFILYIKNHNLRNVIARGEASKQSTTNKSTSTIETEFTPLIIDTAVSTYENNATRLYERSTKAHNTVEVNRKDSSQVWSSFRVANRAKVFDLNFSKGHISAKHDGYKKFKSIHQRNFDYDEKEIKITDIIHSKKVTSGTAYFHFHQDVRVKLIDNVVIANGIKIKFDNYKEITLLPCHLAKSFNEVVNSSKIAVTFTDKLITRIIL